VRETLGVCDSAYILSSGVVLEYGTPDEIAVSKKKLEIFIWVKIPSLTYTANSVKSPPYRV